MSDLSPTLLVFTLGANRESARRGLLPADLRTLEVDLVQSCLEAVLEAGRACGCRLEVCSPSSLPLPRDVLHVPQRGAGFGERLARAAAGARERDAAPLVIVGTDVPGLAARHVEQALSLLAADSDRVVLGPSPDGGLYLLAAGRPIEGLGTVRWCRGDTLRDLLRLLRAAGRPVTLLEPLADLDRRADLESWLAGGPGEDWLRLARELRRILSERRRPVIPGLLGRPRAAFTVAQAGRAPPVPLFR
jgi:2-phospho-L-lactate guanylyltransferase (CobY/MobA/RfbA family)